MSIFKAIGQGLTGVGLEKPSYSCVNKEKVCCCFQRQLKLMLINILVIFVHCKSANVSSIVKINTGISSYCLVLQF